MRRWGQWTWGRRPLGELRDGGLGPVGSPPPLAPGIEDRPKAGLADAGYWSEATSGLAPGQRCLGFLLPPPRIGNNGRCYGRRGVPKGVYQKD